MGIWTSGNGLFLHLWGAYVSPRSLGWLDFTQHLGTCCLIACFSAGLLAMACNEFLSPIFVFLISWVAMCILLGCSKHARCFILLFFLSCGLREGRNALIATGTGMIILGHVENIFHNFKGLLDSMTCNLREKSFAIHIPLLKQYTEALKWLYNLAAPLNLFEDLISWNQTLAISLFSPSQTLESQLNDTKGQVLGAWYQMVSATEVLSTFGRRILTLAGLMLVFLSTGLFLKRFLDPTEGKFKNIYITRKFVLFDEKERHQQKPSVLPLSREERKQYVLIPSFWKTPKERKSFGLFFLPVFPHFCLWMLFAATDYLLYWLLVSVGTHFHNLPALDVHLKLYREDQGTQDLIHGSSFSISLFESHCIPTPRLLFTKTWFPISLILAMLVILGLLSSLLMQLKILVSAAFYPSVEERRMQYLHAKLMKRRLKQPRGEDKRKPSSYYTKIHFWLPVLKIIRKKGMDTESQVSPS
ncbi:dendritic cell-specific transmembrane protein [Suncus etruscus]|uniref:dendritic cell-specific transmembrane protein n=1 Tax=Suncus etruscus TaxID=109475 RepID=UPI00210FC346|nr:dendritic cell-specific transmembrane protein [Suncus etruscus]